MSGFGIGVGDFIAVGTLAWKLYLACSEGNGKFVELTGECLSMHIAIKKIESNIESRSLVLKHGDERDLIQLVANCNGELLRLDDKLKNYRKLSSERKAVWDRVKFANEDLQDIRSKLNLHLTAISTFSDGL